MSSGLEISPYITCSQWAWDGFLSSVDSLNAAGYDCSEGFALSPPDDYRREYEERISRGYVPPDVKQHLLTEGVIDRWQWSCCRDLLRKIHDPNPDATESKSPDPASVPPEPSLGTRGPLGIYAGHENLRVPLLYPDNGGSPSYSELMHREIQGVIPDVCDPQLTLYSMLKRLGRARRQIAFGASDERKDMGYARTKRAITPITGAYLKMARTDLDGLIAQAREDKAHVPLLGKEGTLEVTHTPMPGCLCYHFKPELWIPSIVEDFQGNPKIQFQRIKLTEIKVYADDAGHVMETGIVMDDRLQWQPDEGIWRHHTLRELCMADRLWGQTLRDLYLEGLYRRAKHPGTNTDDTIKAVAQLHWWLAHGMPFNRGSAGIADALTKAIFYSKGIFPGRWRKDVSPDIKAFHLTLRQYVEQYRSFFI